ncbi:hypothetical protein [Geobacillus thermodenitrificans]|uniref:hypothetical protein n=1 Tax=Geobacillus thermodenitrificans TaxID=33940 RepID=UPI001F4F0C0D|nr:hypothetical protein [Geobacillus thermodenitrificans]
MVTVYDFQGGGFFMCIYAFVMRFATRSNRFKTFIDVIPELEGTMPNRWLITLTINPQGLDVTPMDIINALVKENMDGSRFICSLCLMG